MREGGLNAVSDWEDDKWGVGKIYEFCVYIFVVIFLFMVLGKDLRR